MPKLVIIGNGFDLFHGFETTFGDFEQFAAQKNPDAYRLLNQLLRGNTPVNFWSDFENSLGEVENAYFESLILQDPAKSTDLSAWYSIQAHQIAITLESLSLSNRLKGTTSTFRDWVHSIQLPLSNTKGFHFPANAFFVSFNYTEALQKLYGVKSNFVKHIHGLRTDADFEPIVGHGRKVPNYVGNPSCPEELNPSNPWAQYIRNSGKKMRNNLLRIELKCMYQNVDPNLMEVIVLGHSLNEIDIPYFQELQKLWPQANWKFSYYSDADKLRVKQFCERLNITNVVTLKTLSDYETNLSVIGID